MSTDKRTARIVGALFIITMIAGMIDAYSISPILLGPLANVYPNAIRVTVGAILILAMSLGIVGIAVMLFPVLKRHSETVAITYVCFRSIECVLLIVGAIVYFFLIGLSQQYINSGNPDASYFQSIATVAIKLKYSAYQIAMITLGLGSLFLCYSLFQSKLIPRFLSVWGLIGYALLLASALLDIFGIVDTVNGAGAILYVPGGLWEFIAFPMWLFTKGFISRK